MKLCFLSGDLQVLKSVGFLLDVWFAENNLSGKLMKFSRGNDAFVSGASSAMRNSANKTKTSLHSSTNTRKQSSASVSSFVWI